jgi:hypothetical protein
MVKQIILNRMFQRGIFQFVKFNILAPATMKASSFEDKIQFSFVQKYERFEQMFYVCLQSRNMI